MRWSSASACIRWHCCAPLGLRLLIYPGKGYSATFDIVAPERRSERQPDRRRAQARVLALWDSACAWPGTAEIAGWSLDLDAVRCATLTRRTQELFPGACDYARPTYWAGLRPVTPSNVPVSWRRPGLRGLFLNAGHGTLGWTLGPGNGELIAQVVSGTAPRHCAATRDHEPAGCADRAQRKRGAARPV